MGERGSESTCVGLIWMTQISSGPSVDELANRRILREQAVPIGSAVDVDRAEQRRDRRRGQDRLHRNLLAAAVERLEVAGEDVDRTDQEHRRPVRVGERIEVDARLQHPPELDRASASERVEIRADGRQGDHVLQRAGPDGPAVQHLLVRRGRRVVGPERIEQLCRRHAAGTGERVPRQ